MATDNWQHRSSGMVCATCMWWVEKGNGLGRCRRRAPTMNGWPALYHTDWCGDHKLDENKVASAAQTVKDPGLTAA